MMLSIPNDKNLGSRGKYALIAFLTSVTSVKIVSRRDCIELHADEEASGAEDKIMSADVFDQVETGNTVT